MQQKVMQYMMIFMGVMFFKVASGLCLYFIASSLWGIAERKLLPRSTLNTAGSTPQVLERVGPRSPANGNGSPNTKKKNRDRREVCADRRRACTIRTTPSPRSLRPPVARRGESSASVGRKPWIASRQLVVRAPKMHRGSSRSTGPPASSLRSRSMASRRPCLARFSSGRPRSYTRQPSVEIHTIGSPPILQAMLRHAVPARRAAGRTGGIHAACLSGRTPRPDPGRGGARAYRITRPARAGRRRRPACRWAGNAARAFAR